MHSETNEGKSRAVVAIVSKSPPANEVIFELSRSLHTLAKRNNITPVLEPKQFYLLERALRTLYVGNVPQSNDTEVQVCYEEVT